MNRKMKERRIIFSQPLSQCPPSSSREERALGTSPDLLSRVCSNVHCRWLPREKEEPRLQVANKPEALGRSKRRRRRKTKLFDSLHKITAVQESMEKNVVLVALIIDSCVAVELGALWEDNISKKNSSQVQML